MKNCDICMDFRSIRLPVRRPASVTQEAHAGPVAIENSSREYPCPECSETITHERISAVSHCGTITSLIEGDSFMGHIKKSLAYDLVGELLERGYIQFERGPENVRDATYRMYATLGVVSPSIVATLEERISERQNDVAKEVAEEVAQSISAWGSAYHGDEGSIYKSQALTSVKHALSRVMERRSKKRKMGSGDA